LPARNARLTAADQHRMRILNRESRINL
jgi:hypothetical protein